MCVSLTHTHSAQEIAESIRLARENPTDKCKIMDLTERTKMARKGEKKLCTDKYIRSNEGNK